MSVLRVVLAAEACPSTESLKETVGHGFGGLWRDIYFLSSIVLFLCAHRHQAGSQRGYAVETTSPVFEHSFLLFLSLKVLSWHLLFLSFIIGCYCFGLFYYFGGWYYF